MNLERARKIADAVLYEGYVLYPYRASARKNRVRWQFGVVAPGVWTDRGGCERSSVQTEILVEPDGEPFLEGCLRFLRLRRRSVERARPDGGFEPTESLEADGRLWTSWDEGREIGIPFSVELGRGRGEQVFPFELAAGMAIEGIPGGGGHTGRVVRSEYPLEGAIRVTVEEPGRFLRVRIVLGNDTPCDAAPEARDEALRSAFLGTHFVLGLERGRFVSLADPPEAALELAGSCRNEGLWPVLAGEPGEDDLLLCSPIILEDHPRIAPESPGEFFDATEIDELLTLRTLTLTDEEKREARATDPRAADLLDRVETMPPEVFERLHGAIRDLAGASSQDPNEAPAFPRWDPTLDRSVSSESDSIEVCGVRLSKGSRVRLHPGPNADAQDMFLEGCVGRVEAVFFDVDGRRYLAVSVEDDPAAELHRWHGRYLYFAPDEVEPFGDVL